MCDKKYSFLLLSLIIKYLISYIAFLFLRLSPLYSSKKVDRDWMASQCSMFKFLAMISQPLCRSGVDFREFKVDDISDHPKCKDTLYSLNSEPEPLTQYANCWWVNWNFPSGRKVNNHTKGFSSFFTKVNKTDINHRRFNLSKWERNFTQSLFAAFSAAAVHTRKDNKLLCRAM